MEDLMFRLRAIYGSLSSPKEILPDSLSVSQNELVAALLDEHFQKYPPSIEYQKLFWKHIVASIEGSGEEVDERIYERYMQLLSFPTFQLNEFSSGPPQPSYLTYFWPTGSGSTGPLERLTLLESRTTIEAGTTGMRTWRASLLLGEWFLAHPELLMKRDVLELGSGIGFLGVLISKIQAASSLESRDSGSITVSDVDENVLDRCRENSSIQINRTRNPPKIAQLDWLDALSETSEDMHRQIDPRPDVIVGADIVYDSSLIRPLVETLWKFIAKPSDLRVGKEDGTAEDIWIALSVRRDSTISEFLNVVHTRGFAVDDVPWDLPPKRLFMGAWEGGSSNTQVDIKLYHLYIARPSMSS